VSTVRAPPLIDRKQLEANLNKLLGRSHAHDKVTICQSCDEVLDGGVSHVGSTRVQDLSEAVSGVDRKLAGLGAEAGCTLILADKDSRALHHTAFITIAQ